MEIIDIASKAFEPKEVFQTSFREVQYSWNVWRIFLQIVSVHNTDLKSAHPENLSLWLLPKYTSHSCSGEVLQSQNQLGGG